NAGHDPRPSCLKRMRALYAARRAALAEALAAAFGDQLRVSLQSGGIHLLARPSGRVRDTMLVQLAEMQRLAPTALSSLSIQPSAPRVFFLLYQREGAIGRARRDGTIAFHCGISGALLVHFLRRFDPR